jgi:hypothetical protein
MARRVVRLEHTVNLRTALRRPVDPEYRELASAVLLQAFSDAKAGDTRARHFLLGGPSMAFWCELAGLDVNAAVERVTRAVGIDREVAA